jgi:hypothetical protein
MIVISRAKFLFMRRDADQRDMDTFDIDIDDFEVIGSNACEEAADDPSFVMKSQTRPQDGFHNQFQDEFFDDELQDDQDNHPNSQQFDLLPHSAQSGRCSPPSPTQSSSAAASHHSNQSSSSASSSSRHQQLELRPIDDLDIADDEDENASINHADDASSAAEIQTVSSGTPLRTCSIPVPAAILGLKFTPTSSQLQPSAQPHDSPMSQPPPLSPMTQASQIVHQQTQSQALSMRQSSVLVPVQERNQQANQPPSSSPFGVPALSGRVSLTRLLSGDHSSITSSSSSASSAATSATSAMSCSASTISGRTTQNRVVEEETVLSQASLSQNIATQSLSSSSSSASVSSKSLRRNILNDSTEMSMSQSHPSSSSASAASASSSYLNAGHHVPFAAQPVEDESGEVPEFDASPSFVRIKLCRFFCFLCLA